MTSPTKRSEAASYELRVGAHLDDGWSTWFDGLSLTREDDGTTALRGAVADQAELHGLLAKVRDLGVTLISVTPLRTTDDADAQQQQPPERPNPRPPDEARASRRNRRDP